MLNKNLPKSKKKTSRKEPQLKPGTHPRLVHTGQQGFYSSFKLKATDV